MGEVLGSGNVGTFEGGKVRSGGDLLARRYRARGSRLFRARWWQRSVQGISSPRPHRDTAHLAAGAFRLIKDVSEILRRLALKSFRDI